MVALLHQLATGHFVRKDRGHATQYRHAISTYSSVCKLNTFYGNWTKIDENSKFRRNFGRNW